MPAPTTPLLRTTGARSAAIGLALVLALLSAYVLGTGHGGVAAAAPTGQPTAPATGASGVDVVGTGKVTGTPDVLRLDLAVSVTRSDASGSLEALSTTASKVIAALKARHVQGKDIKTSGLSVQPREDYGKDGGIPTIQGYAATESISVVLRDLKTAGATISAATAAGGDASRINGVALDLDGDSALLAQARDAAIADARTKAEGYAKAAGRTLGAVTVITESTDSSSPPQMYDSAMAAGAAPRSSVPVQPGSQQLSVTVRVVWSFA